MDIFTTADLKNVCSLINKLLDLEHIRKRIDNGYFDLKEILHGVLEIMKKLCAPFRDQLVNKLKNEEDPVELFRFISD